MDMNFSRVLAGGLRHAPMLTRERLKLGMLARLACDAASLAPLRELPLDEVLRSPRYAEEWAVVAGELEALSITSEALGVNPGDRRALYHLVRHLKPRSVLEVGTHIGASTAAICAALRRNTAEGAPRPRLVSIDINNVNDPIAKPWIRAGSRYSPAQLVRHMGCEQWVEFVTESSLAFLRRADARFELIFLDGDHTAAINYQEQSAALGRLNPGGSILLHDYFPGLRPLWPDGKLIAGPYLAARRLRDEGVPLDVQPLGALPWPTKQGTTVTSLAVMGRV